MSDLHIQTGHEIVARFSSLAPVQDKLATAIDAALAQARTAGWRQGAEASSNWIRIVLGIHERILKKIEPWSLEDRRLLATGLAGEVGELLNLIKKEWRGDGPIDTRKVYEELADIRISLELLARAFDCSLDEACTYVLEEKLSNRWPEESRAALRALSLEPPGQAPST